MSSNVWVLLWQNLHHHRNLDFSIHFYCVRSLLHIGIQIFFLRTVKGVHWHPPSSFHFGVFLWHYSQVVLVTIFVPSQYSQYIPQLPALIYNHTYNNSAPPIGNVNFDWYPSTWLRIFLQMSEVSSPCLCTNTIHRTLAIFLLYFSPNKNRIHQLQQSSLMISLILSHQQTAWVSKPWLLHSSLF